jgi:transcriptional regulator with XRE-family HTH domain
MGLNLLKLREIREARGISRKALAERSKISYNQIGRIERGESGPAKATAEKIAKALNTTIEYLMGVPIVNIEMLGEETDDMTFYPIYSEETPYQLYLDCYSALTQERRINTQGFNPFTVEARLIVALASRDYKKGSLLSQNEFEQELDRLKKS